LKIQSKKQKATPEISIEGKTSKILTFPF